MPDISVIMPVYNSERYLSKAIDSVLNQTYKNFELLLIDDGSKDNSPCICDEYANRDARVHVIHQPNGGICAARNTGLNVAKGKYITFIDNDDEYAAHLLKDNYRLAQKYHADIVKYGHQMNVIINGKMKSSINYSFPVLTVIKNEQLTEFYPQCKQCGIIDLVWNGLYRMDFVRTHKIHFNTLHKFGYEDFEFNMNLYPKVSTLVVNDKIYYHWMQRYGISTSSKFDIKKFDSIMHITHIEQTLLRRLDMDYDYMNERMTACLSAFLGYMFHPSSTLNNTDRISYMDRFYQDFGEIIAGEKSPRQQQAYVYFYNRQNYTVLFLLKQFINKAKKLLGKERI